MPREVDVRDVRPVNGADDEVIASRRVVRVTGGADSSGPPVTADDPRLLSAALLAVDALVGSGNLDAVGAPGYRVDPQPSKTSSGALAVHLEQTYAEIPVFQAGLTVRFSTAGLLADVAGTVVGWTDPPSVSPSLDPVEATREAIKHLAQPDVAHDDGVDSFGQPRQGIEIDPDSVNIRITAAEDNAAQATRIELMPWASTGQVSLVWLDLSAQLVLGWHVMLELPDAQGTFVVVVDSATGKVLYSRLLTVQVVAKASVSAPDPDTAPQLRSMPEPLAHYPVAAPPGQLEGFPRDDWVSGAATEGNSVAVSLANGGYAAGAAVNGTVEFVPKSDDDRLRVAAHYFCSFAHDLFWLLGFREDDGNFQVDNYGHQGGKGSDRVTAIVYPSEFKGVASMAPSIDGSSPTLRMGPMKATGRHAALDETVVVHEYTHGVVNRLVGSKSTLTSLTAAQAAAMNEGWADYFACVATGLSVIGAWTMQNATGMRSAPYDQSYPTPYSDLAPVTDEHRYGEIWCAALMELDRRLGREIVAQLVVDGLKLTPSNPTYLQGRDAVLSALEDMATARRWDEPHTRLQLHEAWSAFARFGMGVLASSPASTSFVGVQPDFSVPSFDLATYADSDLETYVAGGRQVGPTPALSTWGAGRLDIFCSTSTGLLHTWHAPDADLGTWESVDGAEAAVGSRSGVAACSWGPGRIDTFVIADDGTLHTVSHDPTTGWGSWGTLGGALDPASSPAVASWGPGRLDVFARGPAGELMHLWRDPSAGWGHWESLDQFLGARKLAGGVSAAAPRPGQLIVGGLSSQGYPQVCDYDAWLGSWSLWNLAYTAPPAAGAQPATAIRAHASTFSQGQSPTTRRPVDIDLYAIAQHAAGDLVITRSRWSGSWATDILPHTPGTHRGIGAATWSENRTDLVVTEEVSSGDLYRIGQLVHSWTNSAGAPHQHETINL